MSVLTNNKVLFIAVPYLPPALYNQWGCLLLSECMEDCKTRDQLLETYHCLAKCEEMMLISVAHLDKYGVQCNGGTMRTNCVDPFWLA